MLVSSEFIVILATTPRLLSGREIFSSRTKTLDRAARVEFDTYRPAGYWAKLTSHVPTHSALGICKYTHAASLIGLSLVKRSHLAAACVELISRSSQVSQSALSPSHTNSGSRALGQTDRFVGVAPIPPLPLLFSLGQRFKMNCVVMHRQAKTYANLKTYSCDRYVRFMRKNLHA